MCSDICDSGPSFSFSLPYIHLFSSAAVSGQFDRVLPVPYEPNCYRRYHRHSQKLVQGSQTPLCYLLRQQVPHCKTQSQIHTYMPSIEDSSLGICLNSTTFPGD